MGNRIIACLLLISASSFLPAYAQEIDLLDYSDASGFLVDGAGAWITSTATGDFNGDGLDDLALGVVLAQVGRNRTGAIQIIFGTTGAQSPDTRLLPLPNWGSVTIHHSGLPYSASLKVAAAGDVNNDGLDDLLIDDNPGYNNRTATYERTYVMYGSQSLPFWSVIDLEELRRLLLVTEIIGPADYSGYRKLVTAAGDINDDGIDDIAISYPLQSGLTPWTGNSILTFNIGRVYLLFGQPGGIPSPLRLDNNLEEHLGYYLTDRNHVTSPYTAFGASMAPLGDMNGDGVDDLAISVDYSYAYEGRTISKHAVRILLGDSRLSAPDKTYEESELWDYYLHLGMIEIDGVGGSITSVGGVGDVNDDGLADMLIGSVGKAFVVFGFDLESIQDACRDDLGNDVHVENAISTDCGGGYEIIPRGGDFLPDVYASNGQGDMDGDGLNDVLVSFYKRNELMDNVGAIIFGHPGSGRYIPPSGSTRYLYTNEMQTYTGRRFKLPYMRHHLPTIAGWAGDLNIDGEDGFVFGLPLSLPGQVSARY
ncbi:MAG: integrin alpha [Granulosicoccus sp.]|nr:integrin alpha [Granulosicoccus sp.]